MAISLAAALGPPGPRAMSPLLDASVAALSQVALSLLSMVCPQCFVPQLCAPPPVIPIGAVNAEALPGLMDF